MTNNNNYTIYAILNAEDDESVNALADELDLDPASIKSNVTDNRLRVSKHTSISEINNIGIRLSSIVPVLVEYRHQDNSKNIPSNVDVKKPPEVLEIEAPLENTSVDVRILFFVLATIVMGLAAWYEIDSKAISWFDSLTNSADQQPMMEVPQADGSYILMPVDSLPKRFVQGLEMQMVNTPNCTSYLNSMKSLAYSNYPDNFKMNNLGTMVQVAQKMGCL